MRMRCRARSEQTASLSVVCGAAMLCVGSYLLYRLQEGRGLVPSTVIKPPIILLVLGVAVCLVAGLGWRAAFDKNRWLLILYSVLLVLIVVLELSTAIWGLVLRSDIQDDTTVIMEASFSRYAADNVTRRSWDNIQRKLLCCGTDGPADYRRHGAVPWSCCDDTTSSSPQHVGGGCTHVHQTGCLSRLAGFLEARTLDTSLAAVAAVLIQSTFRYSSPMTSLVLTDSPQLISDSSQLISDSQYLDGWRFLLMLLLQHHRTREAQEQSMTVRDASRTTRDGPKKQGDHVSFISGDKGPKKQGDHISFISGDKGSEKQGDPISFISGDKGLKKQGDPISFISSDKGLKKQGDPISFISGDKGSKKQGDPISFISGDKGSKKQVDPISFNTGDKGSKKQGLVLGIDGPDTSLRSPLGNFLLRLALAGIALLTLGALIQATITEVTDFMAGKFSVPSIALIIVGSIVFIVAFYGCCGAIRESSCMVTTYVIFLMVILVIEIAIAAVAFIYKDDFEDVFTDAVTKAVNNYYTDSGSRTSMDALQVTVSVTFRYQHQWMYGQRRHTPVLVEVKV
uniref:Tetraspanin n=1 Tax=Timema douglasi TaxID=61478 RepID=A0A7R8VTC6_TIMDO|nr:unnamed protein product [Timema douglasi]